MALNQIPGATGIQYARIASGSLNNKAIGKFTDSNTLEELQRMCPTDYDKKIISLYTQTSLYANDFLNMINQSTPFYTKDGSWSWNMEVPYTANQIVAVPATTTSQSLIGIDGKEFELVLKYKVAKNDKFALGNLKYGPQVHVTQDPKPFDRGWLVKLTLVSKNAQIDSVDPIWLSEGVSILPVDNMVGEFDQDLSGLPHLGETIKMYETMGAGFGDQHTITSWADNVRLSDAKGNPLDMLVYLNNTRNDLPTAKQAVMWEPFVEFMMRKDMLSKKINRFIWSRGGYASTNGGRQELKKSVEGVYWKIRDYGNYVPYNRGELTAQLFRDVFGDLFYRRVAVQDRHVKLYTNEAGFESFNKVAKEDALGSGINFTTNVDAVKSGKVSITDPSQHLIYSFAFDGMFSRETGLIELVHLAELDLPQSDQEFGQNKKSAPLYIVFDVSNSQAEGFTGNVREVRKEGMPSMTWGYVNGRRHHLGALASKGYDAANMFPGYTIFMDDESDVFIEDLSKVVLIEEQPQY